jgi:hypothetical protein
LSAPDVLGRPRITGNEAVASNAKGIRGAVRGRPRDIAKIVEDAHISPQN